MKTSFAHNKSPMIVGVIKERDISSAIAKIKQGEYDGARGFDLHIAQLDKEYRNTESIKKIVDSTNKPILALNYNNGYFEPLDMCEEERAETLIYAAEAGCAAIDMQGYTFDKDAKADFVDDKYIPEDMEFLRTKRPKEVALKPEIIKKQKGFINKIHSIGAEVLASVHFGTVLSKEELEKIARFAHSKGADIVKMVAPCTDKYQVPEAIESTIYLKEKLGFPFSYHMNGKDGIITRKLCPLFGSYIVFANVDFGKNADFEQLHVKSMADFYRAIGEY